MTYLYAQPNLTSGIDQAIISTGESVPAFPIMILFFIFTVVLLSGSSAQRRRTGTADIPFWAVLAGISTTLTALVMNIGVGLLNLTTMVIVISITILCGFWFFMSKVRGEQ